MKNKMNAATVTSWRALVCSKVFPEVIIYSFKHNGALG